MNKNSLLHPICHMAATAAMFWIAAYLLTACSSDNDPVALDDNDTTPTEDTTPATAATGCMRLTMEPTATRSLSYDGVTTTMTDGTLIGCVITKGATKSAATYYATAAWEYNGDSSAADNNTLTVKRWWTYDTNSDGNSTWTLHEASTYSAANTDDFSYDSSGYTYINTEDYLYFYFYYPYIDPVNFEGSTDESSIKSHVPSYTTDGSSTTYLMGMPVGEDIASSTNTSIGSYSYTNTEEGSTASTTTTATLTTALPIFSWKTFPVYVNQDQSSQDGINMSDFLYDACEVGINNGTVGDVVISLRKKTAAICVTSGTSLSSVSLCNGTDGNSITLGCYVNLYEDTETAIESTDDKYSYSILGSSSSISPYELTTGMLYRFILPEQSTWGGRLSYQTSTTTDSDGNATTTYTTHNLSLADFGDGKLEHGTLYTVKLYDYPEGGYYLYWSSDGTQVTDGSDIFIESGGDISEHSDTKLEGTSYKYCLKMNSKGYIVINLPTQMVVTMYCCPTNTTSTTTDGKTTTHTSMNKNFYVCKYNASYGTEDPYNNYPSSSAVSTGTISSSATSDDNNGYTTGSITLSKGKYIILRSGEFHVFYVTVTLPSS